MKHIILQRKMPSLVAFLLSILFAIMAGCSEPSNPSGTTSSLAAPTITTHPASQTVTEGSTARLSVVATASQGAALSYQWQRKAKGSTAFTDVTDSTAASFTTPALTVADSGVQYRVVVTATNSKETKSSTSDIATLSVRHMPPPAPVITKQPASQTINEEETATFTVEVARPKNNSITISYQWQKKAKGSTDFTDIKDSTATTYTTPLLIPADSGTQYRVVVTASNSLKETKSTTSDVATLSVLSIPPAVPVITKQPSSQTIRESNTASLSVTATAHRGTTLSYQWQSAPKGSTTFTDITDSTAASITTPTLFPADSGVQYRVLVTATDAAAQLTNTITSDIAIISVLTVPKIVWTHIDGTRRYTYAPEDGILVSSLLTAVKTDIRSVDTIPNVITSIGTSAFDGCTALASINIPEGVTTIMTNAFSGCTALSSISLPSSVSEMETAIFQGCTSLASIVIPSGIDNIGNGTFKGCTALRSINIPSNIGTIGTAAFSGCTSLASVTMQSGIIDIAEDAFRGCAALTSITIPVTVSFMGNNIFNGCSKLASVRVEVTKPPTVGVGIFDGTHASLLIRVPDASVNDYRTAEGWRAYSLRIYGYNESTQIVWTHRDGTRRYAAIPADNMLLSSVLTATKADIKSVDTIPNGITSIGVRAFDGCTALASISIPSNVASVGDSAFLGCKALASVRVERVIPPTARTNIFENTNADLLIRVPDANVTAYRTADNWSNYKSRIYGFNETLPRIVWTHRNGTKQYANAPINGRLLSSTLTATKADIKSIDTIPITITSIVGSAFQGCTNLTSITIPTSVTSIATNAFADCTGLTSIILPSSISDIGAAAFKGSTNLSSVRVEAATPPLAGIDMFSGTHSSLRIHVPDSSASAYVGAANWSTYADRIYPKIVWTFINETSKRYTTVPADGILTRTTLVADPTFNMTNIISVDTIPSSITSIANRAFASATLLQRINIPSRVTSIGEEAFSGCRALTSITIPNSVTSMGANAFYGCRSLTSITLSNSLTSLRGITFSGCGALTSITIPASVTSMGDWEFADCIALTSVRMESTTPPKIGADVFYNTHADLIIRVPDGSVDAYKKASNWSNYANKIYGYSAVISKIVWTDINGNKRYANAPSDGVLSSRMLTATVTDIKSVDTIPSSITSIAVYAFTGCTALTSINIPNSVTSIKGGAFYGCTALTSIVIPNKVTSIEGSVFSGCTGLTSITIPSSVTSIENSAFANTGLTSITIPANVTSIGESAFSTCTALTSLRVEATTPPSMGSGVFYSVPSSLSITVPSGSVATYKAADFWSIYANQITGY